MKLARRNNVDTRILIADRQDMFREALRRLLELQPGFSVVGDTDSGEQLLPLVSKHNPDILLLDIKLRGISGIEALHEIASLPHAPRAILLTDVIGPTEMIQAILWGVCGVVHKKDPTHLLFKSIQSVMQGEYWISRQGFGDVVQNLRSMAAVIEQNAQNQARSLSVQQQQIIESIVAGCSNKDIASALSISERTVKYHLTRIFEKFGVSGRMQLARYSLKNNVLRQA